MCCECQDEIRLQTPNTRGKLQVRHENVTWHAQILGHLFISVGGECRLLGFRFAGCCGGASGGGGAALFVVFQFAGTRRHHPEVHAQIHTKLPTPYVEARSDV